MTITLPAHLSYSAVSSYAECGERYRLSRGYHKDNATWYATLAGTAIHEITEALDLNRDFGAGVPVPDFKERFLALVEQEVAKGVEVKASGKEVKTRMTPYGGPNKKDVGWWLHYGPQYIEAWTEWRNANPYLTLAIMPDGQPGVEVSIQDTVGGVPFVGYIDRVFIDTTFNTLWVVDLKTGNEPSSRLQLKVYAIALDKQFGLEARFGGFWMAPKGMFAGNGEPVDLETYSAEYVENQFAMARNGIEAGIFLASPSSFCVSCPVRDYCRAQGGRLVDEIPVTQEVQFRAPLESTV